MLLEEVVLIACELQYCRIVLCDDHYGRDKLSPCSSRTGAVANEESDLYTDEPEYRLETADDMGVAVHNMVHAARNEDEARDEIEHFFDDEIFDHLA